VISIDQIHEAGQRIEGRVVRTPLLPLNVQQDEAPCRIWLKLENLQPIGAFKVRGALNAILLTEPEELEAGVWTASAGNMAQALAWVASDMGLSASVVVPDTAPATKTDSVERLGGRVVRVPMEEWLEVFESREHPQMDGLMIHPFDDPNVMAGNGTIGLEILEDLPDVDAVVIPYGGGGLACGIASALRSAVPDVLIYASEVDTAAPLAASLGADHPVTVEFTPSYVDGIGAPHVFPGVFDLARELLDGSIVRSVEQISSAIRLLVQRNQLVAEGAGASSVAAALSGEAGEGDVVCVVSGGNIDPDVLARILEDR